MRHVRLIVRAVAVIVATLALVGPVAAKSPVDPNTLNPPPPDFFNATCEQTGSHILCNLAFSDPDVMDEPSGIVCGSTELLFSQRRSVVGKRFYDADGNLYRRHPDPAPSQPLLARRRTCRPNHLTPVRASVGHGECPGVWRLGLR